MITRVSVTGVSILAIGVALVATGASGATWYPGYYTAALPGVTSLTAASPQGWSLLSNGTVVGISADIQIGSVNGMPPAFPFADALTWSVNASTATMTNLGNVEGLAANQASTDGTYAVYGDDYGRYGCTINTNGPVGLWNPTSQTFTNLGNTNSNLTWADLYGESESGLLFGGTDSGTAFAFDLNTNAYYTFGPANTSPNEANASGYVVGQDGGGTKGFVWSEATQSYNLIPGLSNAWAISNNSQLVAGQNQSSQAAVYTPSGTLVNTYWNGRATFVNDSGTVVGDTETGWALSQSSGRAMAEIKGQTIDLSSAYAPAGVTFNYCEGLNDAGQILVWSGGTFWAGNGGVTSYVLTPGLPGDANLDGKVDINDLTIVLAHYNQSGMTWADGEFTGSGTVDINDLTIVLAHYNDTVGSAAGSLAAVPEPASVVLLACCAAAALLLAALRGRK